MVHVTLDEIIIFVAEYYLNTPFLIKKNSSNNNDDNTFNKTCHMGKYVQFINCFRGMLVSYFLKLCLFS